MDELLGNVLGVAVGASVNYAQAAVHVIDFYLDDAQEKERNHIIQLVNGEDNDNGELLRGYVREAMRKIERYFVRCFHILIPLLGLRPQFPGLWREALVDATVPLWLVGITYPRALHLGDEHIPGRIPSVAQAHQGAGLPRHRVRTA